MLSLLVEVKKVLLRSVIVVLTFVLLFSLSSLDVTVPPFALLSELIFDLQVSLLSFFRALFPSIFLIAVPSYYHSSFLVAFPCYMLLAPFPSRVSVACSLRRLFVITHVDVISTSICVDVISTRDDQ